MNVLFKHKLKNELKKWQNVGIVDKNTAFAITNFYGISASKSETNFVLKLIAYLFLALSLIVLIGSNWETIPRELRVGLLFFVTFALHFVAVRKLGVKKFNVQFDKSASKTASGGKVRVNLVDRFTQLFHYPRKNSADTPAHYKTCSEKDDSNSSVYSNLHDINTLSSTALFFLGNLCFAASVILISQIYSIGEYMSDGVLFIAIATLPLGLVLINPILTAQTLVFASIWFFMEIYFGNISYGFLIFILISVVILFIKESKTLLFLTLLAGYGFGVCYFILNTPIANVSFSEFIFFTPTYLLATHIGSNLVAKFSQIYAEFMRNFALYLGVGFLLLVSILQMVDENLFFYVTYYKYAVVALLLALVALYYKSYYVLPFLVMLLAFNLFLWGGLWVKVVVSFLLFAIGVKLIRDGLNFGLKGDFRFGLFILFVLALVRYIDLLGDYIGASLLFLIFAVIMLVLSRKLGDKKIGDEMMDNL